jgi:hypothetical protein
VEVLNVAVLFAALTVIRFASDAPSEYVSPVHEVTSGFTTAIASWNVVTPSDAWMEAQLRVRVGDRWSRWYTMGEWSRTREDNHRHSVARQADADGTVDTDTLELVKHATAWQLQLHLHAAKTGERPMVSLLAVTTGSDLAAARAQAERAAWGIELDVPERTQRALESPDALAGGGDAWCSPTSVSMIMAYWAQRENAPSWDVGVSAAAQGTYDPVYDGCGNWPFNVAFASEHGLAGWVERLSGIAEMERYIIAGIPLAASIRVAPGQLHGSPYPKTDGHLLVVRGFTSGGNVIANDPYALPGHIRIIYDRTQFENVWMHGSGGVVYVIAPAAMLSQFKP